MRDTDFTGAGKPRAVEASGPHLLQETGSATPAAFNRPAPDPAPASTARVFRKSWGAELISPGEACFRTWAPGQEVLALRLDGRDVPMERDDQGWFELRAAASAGAEYAFVLPDGTAVPDPASRCQVGDVHGPSRLLDPGRHRWRDGSWRGRPWEEAVIYELHVGTFTAGGTFRAAIGRLGHLARTGVTAVEIMPVAQFAGERGWGYDGVLLYAPHPAYGPPEDLKSLVEAAHAHGLMVLLDVVYNHFGAEGSYLSLLSPAFFHPEDHTLWGARIAYDKAPVRSFFIDNALYWLEEFHLDGLRLDAIDHIDDCDSEVHLLVELAERVRAAIPDRPIHLATEDARNVTFLHERSVEGRPMLYTAEWNDDFHNAAHVIATGEIEGYYEDFKEDRWGKLARSLAEGFAFQGEHSEHAGAPRGVPSAAQPCTAFVDFIQNHDQIGNRAFGERLLTLAGPEMVRELLSVLLLSPHIPLLFMGEEFGEVRPFQYFTDLHGELADAVREGRRAEFASFSAFRGEGEDRLAEIPDPNAEETFSASRLDWQRADSEAGRDWLAFVSGLLRLRRDHVVPLLAGAEGDAGRVLPAPEGVIAVDWSLDGALLQLRANLCGETQGAPGVSGDVVHALPADAAPALATARTLAPSAVVVALDRLRSPA